MTKKHILAASILLLLGVAPQVKADVTFAAQPVTLSTLVGNDQTDFFVSESAGNGYVVFTANVPLRGGVNEQRLMYKVKTSSPGKYYPVVSRLSPMTRIGLFTVPAGTVFDNFLGNDITADETFAREIFHIPNKGVYLSTNGGAPALLRAETVTFPLSNAVFRYPGGRIVEPVGSRDQELRVMFGGDFLRKGFEPLTSAGTARTTVVLGEVTPGPEPSAKTGLPAQFATFGDREVYFVALNPASVAAQSAQPYDIYRSAANGTAGLLKVVQVTSGLTDMPHQLTGMTSGLFYTATATGSLQFSTDGSTFTQAFDLLSNPVNYATQLTPQISPSSGQVQHSLAMSAYDSVAGVYRLAIFDTGFNPHAYFVDLPNQVLVATTAPAHITPTGSYFYYTASLNGAGPYLMRCFDGDSTGVQLVDIDTDGNHVTNITEVARVTDNNSSGGVFFVGDAVVDGAAQTGILFRIQSDLPGDNNGVAIASAARTVGGALVRGAHNLRGVNDGNVFRLYFSAPVSALPADNGLRNPEYAPTDIHHNVILKDFGNKPWVYGF